MGYTTMKAFIHVLGMSFAVGMLHAAEYREFPAFFPRFSWDTVPVYQMFADTRLLTEQELEEVATTSEFICIEKQHGIRTLGAADLGAKQEIGRFKAVKPGMKCLVYFNSALAYPLISSSKVFHRRSIEKAGNEEYRSFLITDPKTGKLAFREGDHVHYFDVLNAELRVWWTKTVGAFVRDADGDGLFVDQMHGFAWLRKQRETEVAEAQALMMRMAKDAIGREKILLLNNAAHIPELFEIGDAFMFEHFSPDLLTKKKIVSDWALMKKISRAKKIGVWRIGVEHDEATVALRKNGGRVTPTVLEALSRKRMPYYLAAFLIGAQEHSYFQYGWGWKLKTGPLCGYPELKKPLGKPRGDYTRIDPGGWTFRREFEHAIVRLDLDAREGRIEWR